MRLPSCVNTRWFGGHTGVLFSISCTVTRSCLKSGKSWLLCLWNGEERNNELTCAKAERLTHKGVSVFYSESSSALVNQTENHCVCYLTCSRGSCKMEHILDLLSSVAVTFLLSESAAERGSIPVLWMIARRERDMKMEEERSYSIWLIWELNLSGEGSNRLVSVLSSINDSLSSSLSFSWENTLPV